MADKQNQKPKQKGGGGRTTVLAGLLAVVALVAVWLSDCIPGFGLGSQGDGDGQAKSEPRDKVEPAQPEPEPNPEPEPEPEPKPLAKPMPLKLTIDARGCMANGGEAFDCATLCEQTELLEGLDAVVIDAKDGPHDRVINVLDCLKTKNIPVSIDRN